MPSIAQIREKYPQYGDLSDDQLARGMHAKFYADMPFQEFASKIGYRGSQEVNTAAKQDVAGYEAPSMVEDVGKSLATGLRQGVETIVGGLGDAAKVQGDLAGAAASYLGASPETAQTVGAVARRLNPFPMAPTTQEVNQMTDAVVGQDYVPQTTEGMFGRAVGQFAPAAAVPGGIVRRAASAIVPAVASEAAGQAAEGTGYETEARFAGGLAGGLASAGRTSRAALVRNEATQAAKTAPSQAQLSDMTNQAYQKLRDAGIRFDNNQYARMVRDIAVDARKKGWRGSTHKEALDIINDLASDVNKPLDFDTINGRISALGEVARDASATGNARLANAANFIRNRLMGFEKNAPFVADTNISGVEKGKLLKEAKQFALRNIKAREINRVMETADVGAGGDEAGVRNAIRKLLRSKQGRSLFKGDERELLLQVANGRKPLQQLSRLGFDVFQNSGNAMFVPLLGTLLAGTGLGIPAGIATAAAGTAAKALSPAMTRRALDQATAAVRSGALAGQNNMQQERLLRQARALISSSLAD